MTVEDVIWFGVLLCCGIVASILWLGRNGPVEIPPQRDDEPLRKLFEELK